MMTLAAYLRSYIVSNTISGILFCDAPFGCELMLLWVLKDIQQNIFCCPLLNRLVRLDDFNVQLGLQRPAVYMILTRKNGIISV